MREFPLTSSDSSKRVTPTMKGASTSADRLFTSQENADSSLFDNAFMGTNTVSLKLEALKREGIKIMSNTENEYKLVLPSNLTASQAFKLVSSLNPGIEVAYTEEMEEQAELLAKKTKKPLWSFESEGNTIKLKRMF